MACRIRRNNLDRALDGNLNYFYYSRLTASGQSAYDVLVAAIRNHEDTAILDVSICKDIFKVAEAIEYDHPELFWYKALYWSSFFVTLCSKIMLYIEPPLASYSY